MEKADGFLALSSLFITKELKQGFRVRTINKVLKRRKIGLKHPTAHAQDSHGQNSQRTWLRTGATILDPPAGSGTDVGVLNQSSCHLWVLAPLLKGASVCPHRPSGCGPWMAAWSCPGEPWLGAGRRREQAARGTRGGILGTREGSVAWAQESFARSSPSRQQELA